MRSAADEGSGGWASDDNVDSGSQICDGRG
jgi:hypothetical protein